mmetsp:Transcript_7716/g.9651  ORF Transcript_7716/g.9651 Transcript_7716/m.9651 type:complete len:86 (+) Transcript_7716:181-438(+)
MKETKLIMLHELKEKKLIMSHESQIFNATFLESKDVCMAALYYVFAGMNSRSPWLHFPRMVIIANPRYFILLSRTKCRLVLDGFT